VPNPANVAYPINIHGLGRSGTTLLQNLLGCYPFIQVCNETLHLWSHAYRGGELMTASHDKEAVGIPGDGRLGPTAVRTLFCALMPSAKPAWCQKLGGIPNSVVWTMMSTADRDHAATPYAFPYAWYWSALRSSFPHSIDLLILRDWRNTIVSRAKYSDFDPLCVAADLAVYLHLMAHPGSRIDHVVRLEELIAGPATVMKSICDTIGITYDESCLQALNWYAAAGRQDIAEARGANFSWREAYHALGAEFDCAARSLMEPALDRIKVRFGIDLDRTTT
jgi:hypothetical protein